MQKLMSNLFECSIDNISLHLKNIFATNELDEKVVFSILENTTQHGAMSEKIN